MVNFEVPSAFRRAIRTAIVVFFAFLAFFVLSGIVAIVTFSAIVLPLLFHALIAFVTTSYIILSFSIVGVCVLGLLCAPFPVISSTLLGGEDPLMPGALETTSLDYDNSAFLKAVSPIVLIIRAPFEAVVYDFALPSTIIVCGGIYYVTNLLLRLAMFPVVVPWTVASIFVDTKDKDGSRVPQATNPDCLPAVLTQLREEIQNAFATARSRVQHLPDGGATSLISLVQEEAILQSVGGVIQGRHPTQLLDASATSVLGQRVPDTQAHEELDVTSSELSTSADDVHSVSFTSSVGVASEEVEESLSSSILNVDSSGTLNDRELSLVLPSPSSNSVLNSGSVLDADVQSAHPVEVESQGPASANPSSVLLVPGSQVLGDPAVTGGDNTTVTNDTPPTSSASSVGVTGGDVDMSSSASNPDIGPNDAPIIGQAALPVPSTTLPPSAVDLAPVNDTNPLADPVEVETQGQSAVQVESQPMIFGHPSSYLNKHRYTDSDPSASESSRAPSPVPYLEETDIEAGDLDGPVSISELKLSCLFTTLGVDAVSGPSIATVVSSFNDFRAEADDDDRSISSRSSSPSLDYDDSEGKKMSSYDIDCVLTSLLEFLSVDEKTPPAPVAVSTPEQDPISAAAAVTQTEPTPSSSAFTPPTFSTFTFNTLITIDTQPDLLGELDKTGKRLNASSPPDAPVTKSAINDSHMDEGGLEPKDDDDGPMEKSVEVKKEQMADMEDVSESESESVMEEVDVPADHMVDIDDAPTNVDLDDAAMAPGEGKQEEVEASDEVMEEGKEPETEEMDTRDAPTTTQAALAVSAHEDQPMEDQRQVPHPVIHAAEALDTMDTTDAPSASSTSTQTTSAIAGPSQSRNTPYNPARAALSFQAFTANRRRDLREVHADVGYDWDGDNDGVFYGGIVSEDEDDDDDDDDEDGEDSQEDGDDEDAKQDGGEEDGEEYGTEDGDDSDPDALYRGVASEGSYHDFSDYEEGDEDRPDNYGPNGEYDEEDDNYDDDENEEELDEDQELTEQELLDFEDDLAAAYDREEAEAAAAAAAAGSGPTNPL